MGEVQQVVSEDFEAELVARFFALLQSLDYCPAALMNKDLCLDPNCKIGLQVTAGPCCAPTAAHHSAGANLAEFLKDKGHSLRNGRLYSYVSRCMLFSCQVRLVQLNPAQTFLFFPGKARRGERLLFAMIDSPVPSIHARYFSC